MPRSRNSAAAAVAALLWSGCAFDDGQPWGQAQFEVSAAFAPGPDRLEDGALKTAQDFRVDITSLELDLLAAELELSSAGEVAAFDPANPPAGFSLCHNGHCHAADGSLVPYEEIAVDQAAGDFVVSQDLGSVALASAARDVPRGVCTDDCRLERGALGLVRVRVEALRLAATVTDVRDRLAEPLTVELDVELDTTLSTTVDGVVGPGEPGGVRVVAELRWPASFLDEVDFSANPDDWAASLRGAVEASRPLTATIERFDL